MNRDTKRKILYETLTILGVIALLTFICRLWPLLLLVFLIAIITTVRLLVLTFKKSKQEIPEEVKPISETVPTEQNVIDTAFSLICERISESVRKIYPDAKWVWEKPSAKSLILDGIEVFVILNKDGGYRRAKVLISNLMFSGIEFVEADTENKPNGIPDINVETAEVISDVNADTVNYELVAFEWVENNILELNKRCNEMLGNGQNEYVLQAAELPVQESWENVCGELKRAGLKSAEILADGIKIKF